MFRRLGTQVYQGGRRRYRPALSFFVLLSDFIPLFLCLGVELNLLLCLSLELVPLLLFHVSLVLPFIHVLSCLYFSFFFLLHLSISVVTFCPFPITFSIPTFQSLLCTVLLSSPLFSTCPPIYRERLISAWHFVILPSYLITHTYTLGKRICLAL